MSKRGFASMDPAKQKEIASLGGRIAHQKGTAHQFTAEEAKAAGQKGGGKVSQDRAHMAEIGRMGGKARGKKQQQNPLVSAPTGDNRPLHGMDMADVGVKTELSNTAGDGSDFSVTVLGD